MASDSISKVKFHIKNLGGDTYIDLSPIGMPYVRSVVIKGMADYAVIWDDLHIY